MGLGIYTSDTGEDLSRYKRFWRDQNKNELTKAIDLLKNYLAPRNIFKRVWNYLFGSRHNRAAAEALIAELVMARDERGVKTLDLNISNRIRAELLALDGVKGINLNGSYISRLKFLKLHCQPALTESSVVLMLSREPADSGGPHQPMKFDTQAPRIATHFIARHEVSSQSSGPTYQISGGNNEGYDQSRSAYVDESDPLGDVPLPGQLAGLWQR